MRSIKIGAALGAAFLALGFATQALAAPIFTGGTAATAKSGSAVERVDYRSYRHCHKRKKSGKWYRWCHGPNYGSGYYPYYGPGFGFYFGPGYGHRGYHGGHGHGGHGHH
jgi:hypothetical protein